MGVLLLDHLTGYRTMLSESAAFRTLTGAADESAALDYIHIYRAEPDAAWPAFASITDPDEDALTLNRHDAAQGRGAFEGSRSAVLTVYQFLAAGTDWDATNSAAFMTSFGTIVDELLDIEGTDTRQVIDYLRKLPSGPQLPFRIHDEGRKGYQLAIVLGQALYGGN